MQKSKSELQDDCAFELRPLPASGSRQQLADRLAYCRLGESYSDAGRLMMVGLRLEVQLPRASTDELKWFGATLGKRVVNGEEYRSDTFILQFDAHPDLPYASTTRKVKIDSGE